jgi:hypothetical protein
MLVALGAVSDALLFAPAVLGSLDEVPYALSTLVRSVAFHA